jgi:M6 family metalloprotease-like protein
MRYKNRTSHSFIYFVLLIIITLISPPLSAAQNPKDGKSCGLSSKDVIRKNGVFTCVNTRDGLKWKFLTKKKAKQLPNPLPLAPTTTLSDSTRLSEAKNCQTRSQVNSRISQGFPRSEETKIVNGQFNLIAIKVKFKDFPESAGTEIMVRQIFEGSRKFYSKISFGLLELRWEVSEKTYDLGVPVTNYYSASRQVNLSKLIQDSVTMADADVDFSKFEGVVVALPADIKESIAGVSPAMVGGNLTNNENPKLSRGTVLAGDAYRIGESILSHEIGHLIGLPDYYSYAGGSSPTAQFEFMGVFDYMNYAPGKGREPLAWNRWLLSFIDDSRVLCLSNLSGEVTQLITPVARSQGIFKLAVIPLTDTTSIGIESRRIEGFDSALQTPGNSGGLLVYFIDGSIRSGYGPIRIIRPTKSKDPLFQDALLEVNESLNYENYIITNVESGEWGDVFRVSKTK